MLNTPERPAYKPFCEKLLACAYEEQSDFLFALAYFCLMHYYSNDNNHEEAIRCALAGIKYQQKAHEYEFIARSYNILGLFTQAIGDSTKAVDYLLYSCLLYTSTFLSLHSPLMMMPAVRVTQEIPALRTSPSFMSHLSDLHNFFIHYYTPAYCRHCLQYCHQ